MKLSVLASGSSGNGYIIHNNDEAIVVETGVRFTEVKKALDFNISKIRGVVISHGHL
jgi:phosphoribosyl 1,2-cyclic phosphodiesterase